MDNDKTKKSSELSENNGRTNADSRFDVLDKMELDDITDKGYTVGVSGDFSDSSLDELFSELDAVAEQAGGTDDFVVPDSTVFEEAKEEAEEEIKEASPAAGDVADGDVNEPEKDLSDTGTIEFRRGEVIDRDAVAPKAAKKGGVKKKTGEKSFSREDVDRAAATISSLVEAGKLTSALDLVLCLRGAFRQAVREKASITIPLGSRDADLRRIAAGALIQSYLEQGKIVRRDIENKLYAIIESSEPDQADGAEQSPADVLYKVTACMTFAAELTEKSGNHPDEKRAMYAAGDSVLDSFLADNIDEVCETNEKRVQVLADAIGASGGEVAEKFLKYYDEAKARGGSPIARFFGDSTAFKVAAAVVGLLCFVTLVLYIVKFPSSGVNAQILGFVAKENSPIMLFAIAAELFLTAGIAILCFIIGFGGKSKDKKKKSDEE